MLTLDDRVTVPPRALVLHLPWFMAASAVTADRRPVSVGDTFARLPTTAKRVEIRGPGEPGNWS